MPEVVKIDSDPLTKNSLENTALDLRRERNAHLEKYLATIKTQDPEVSVQVTKKSAGCSPNQNPNALEI